MKSLVVSRKVEICHITKMTLVGTRIYFHKVKIISRLLFLWHGVSCSLS